MEWKSLNKPSQLLCKQSFLQSGLKFLCFVHQGHCTNSKIICQTGEVENIFIVFYEKCLIAKALLNSNIYIWMKLCKIYAVSSVKSENVGQLFFDIRLL